MIVFCASALLLRMMPTGWEGVEMWFDSVDDGLAPRRRVLSCILLFPNQFPLSRVCIIGFAKFVRGAGDMFLVSLAMAERGYARTKEDTVTLG